MTQVFQDIHDGIGNSKIKDCFLVDIDFQNQSFILKAVKCLLSFINKDFSAKPWNRSSHFESFIAPKVNESLSFKDHRFNRIFDCVSALLHHLDDIKDYLEKNQNVINGISIIDRGFLDMEILKPIFCATSLMGVHITRPLMHILLDNETTYTNLGSIFTKLYNDLTVLQAHHFLQTSECVTSFSSSDVFKLTLPKPTILSSIEACLQEHRNEVRGLLVLFLHSFAKGLSTQKGSLFGFGPTANEDTGSLLKIASASDDVLEKLNTVPVHNLGEERSVGLVNYKMNIYGKRNLDTVSRSVILNKSSDLLENIQKVDRKKWENQYKTSKK